MIYLKGGHYIVADNCTFSTKHAPIVAPVIRAPVIAPPVVPIVPPTVAPPPSLGVIRPSPERGVAPPPPVSDDVAEREESSSYQDCTQGEPEGRIFWSTINGKFGEVNADDVYAILGARTLTLKKPPPAKGPLEDYLITNRGESFVGAKAIQEEENRIYGMKRDELAKIDRRGVTDIVREGEAKTRSGEGLCPGESAEFSVTETELVGSNLVGVVTNLSKAPWKPKVEVEVRERGRLKGKFRVTDRFTEDNVLGPDETTPFDEPVPTRFLTHVERRSDPDAGIQLCYRKVKTGARQPVVGQSPTAQPSK